MSHLDLRSLSHFPPILPNGTSSTRFHEHSTTAAPYCSRSSLSAAEIILLAFGLPNSQHLIDMIAERSLPLRDHNSGMLLTDGELTHQAQPHKLLPRASLCIAVTQVPTSCLVLRSSSLFIIVIAGCSLAGWIVRLLPSGEVILFVADHFKLACAQ